MTQTFTMFGTVVEFVRVYPDPVQEAVVAFNLKDEEGGVLNIRTRYQSHALQQTLKLDDTVFVVGELRRYRDTGGGQPHLVIWATHVFLAPRDVLAKLAAVVQSFPPHPEQTHREGEGGQGGEAAVPVSRPSSGRQPSGPVGAVRL